MQHVIGGMEMHGEVMKNMLALPVHPACVKVWLNLKDLQLLELLMPQ